MLRKIGATLALALVVGGCGNKAGQGPGSGITITSPIDGQPLSTRYNDTDTTAPGLQIDVHATAVNLDGESATLLVDSVPAPNQDGVTVSGGSITFRQVTLTNGPRALQVQVGDVFSNIVNVTVDDTPVGDQITVSLAPEKTAFGIADDRSSEPGLQFDVTIAVNSPNQTTCETIRVCAKSDGVDLSGGAACSNGFFEVLAAFSPSSNLVTVPVTLPSGTACDGYSATLEAECKVGPNVVTSQASPAIALDVVAPVLTWTTPSGSEPVIIDTLPTTLVVSSSCSDLAQVVVKDENGNEVCSNGLIEGKATCRDINLATGFHTLTASTRDRVGNPAADARIRISVDAGPTQGCSVQFTQPSSESTLVLNTLNSAVSEGAGGKKGTYHIEGTSSCPGGLANFALAGGNSQAPASVPVDASGRFAADFEVVDADQGRLTVGVTAVGKKPDVHSDWFDYQSDFTIPDIAAATIDPIPDPITDASFTLHVHVADADDGRVRVTSSLGGASGAAPVAGGNAEVTLTGLAEGQQDLTVTIYDAAGNPSETRQMTVWVNRTGCVINALDIPPVAPNGYFNLTNYGSAAVAGSSTDRTFVLNGASAACPGGALTVTYGAKQVGTATVRPDGTFTVQVQLSDGDSGALSFRITKEHFNPNAPPKTASFAADFTPPAIGTLSVTAPAPSPAGSSVYPSQTLTLAVATTASAHDCTVSGGGQSGSATVGTDGTANVTISQLALGPVTLSATCTDAAGNVSAAKTLAVIIDVAGCVVNLSASDLVFGLGNTSGTGLTRAVNITGDSPNCKTNNPKAIVSKYLGTNPTPTVTSPATVDATGHFSVSVNVSDGDDGHFVVQVYSDSASMNAGVQATFMADFTPPTISWVTAADSLFGTLSPTITVQVAHTDPRGRALASSIFPKIKVNGAEVATLSNWNGNQVSGTVPLTTWGAVNLAAEIKDFADNAGTTASPLRIWLDTGGCAVALTAPAATPDPFVFSTVTPGISGTGTTRAYTVTGSTTTALCQSNATPGITASVKVTVGGTVFNGTVNGDGTFSVPVQIPETATAKQIVVTVSRTPALATNTGVTRNYIAGFTPPVITWTAPTPATPYALLTSLSAPLSFSVTGSVNTKTLSVTTDKAGAPAPGSVPLNASGTGTINPSNLTAGLQNLTANVSDTYGNAAAPVSIPVMVDTAGCAVAVTAPAATPDPFVFSTVTPGISGTGTTRNYTVTGSTTTALCQSNATPGITASVKVTVGGTVFNGTVNGDGTFSVPVQIPETATAKQIVVTVSRTPALATNTGVTRNYIAGFTPPVITWTAPTPATPYALLTSLTAPLSFSVTGSVNTKTLSVTTDKSGAPAPGSVQLNASGTGTIDPSNLTAGLQNLTANVSDSFGNLATPATIPVMVDTAGCAVAVTAPAATPDPFVFSTVTPGISGTGTTRNYTVTGSTTTALCQANATPGVTASVKVTVGGTAFNGTVNGDGTFSVPVQIPETATAKQIVVTVSRTPALATNAGVTRNYIAGFTPPVITWTAPTPATPYALLTSLTAPLSFSVTGSVNTKTLSVTTDKAGAPVPGSVQLNAAGTGTIAPSDLTAGLQNLTANVSDSFGNPAAPASLPVMVDTAGCAVAVTAPAATPDPFVFSTATPGITGTGTTRNYTVTGSTSSALCQSDATPGITATAKVVVNGTTYSGTVNPDGSFSVPVQIAETAVVKTLVVTVERSPELASNAGTTLNYVADFTAPLINFSSLQDNDIIPPNGDIAVTTLGAEEGQEVTLTVAGVGPFHGYVDATGSATIHVTGLPTGTQTLRASVTDRALNPNYIDVSVLVDDIGCVVTITNPADGTIFALANTAAGGDAQTRTFLVTGNANKCKGGAVTITRTIGGNSTTAGTGTVQSDGTFAIITSVLDGDVNGTLNVKVVRTPPLVDNAGVDLTYSADFSAPVITNASPAIAGADQYVDIHIVYAGHPNAGQSGYVVDADSGTPGGQIDWTLTVAGAGRVGGTGSGSVTVAGAGNSFVSPAITNNAALPYGSRFTFAEGTTGGTVDAAAVDAAGNATNRKLWRVVEVATIAPPPITWVSAPPRTVNVTFDLNNGKSVNAKLNTITINIGGPVAVGSVAYLCSTIGIGAGALPCRGGAGTPYYQVPTTPGPQLNAIQGQLSFYAAALAPGDQKFMAEYYDPTTGLPSNSPTLDVTVDIVPPSVATFRAAADVNADNVLSGLESSAGSPIVLTITFTGVEDQQDATLKENGIAIDSPKKVVGNAVSFTLTNANNIKDGVHTYMVSVTDRAGNPNEIIDPVLGLQPDPKATLELTVQRTPPSILATPVSPSFSVCNKARDGVPATSDCELSFTVSVGATAVGVEFSDAAGNYPTPQVLAPILAGLSTKAYSLGQGASMLKARAVDQYGVISATEVVVPMFVDTIAPVISITSPSAGAVLNSAEFAVTVSAVGAEDAQRVDVTSSAGGGGSDFVSSEAASVNVHMNSSGVQTLTASVTDAAGNKATSAPVSITTVLGGCDINITQPSGALATLNATTAPGGVYEVIGTVDPACAGQPVEIYQWEGSHVLLATISATGGTFRWPHAFADGTRTVIVARITFGVVREAAVTIDTDITPPVLTLGAPSLGDPSGSPFLYVVAQNGNRNTELGAAGYLADASSAAGGQVAFSVTCNGCGDAVNSGTGHLSIAEGPNTLYSLTFTGNNAQTFAPTLTLTQGFSGAVTITAVDAAGNQAQLSWTTVVDVVPPPAPTLTSATLVNDRHADFDAVFTPSVDDGPSFNPLEWEFGYTTRTRLNGAAFDETAFYNSALTTPKPVASAPVPGTPTTISVLGIAPINTYVFAARVVDGVGNRSALVERTLANTWTKTTFDYPGATFTLGYFGSPIVTGDINGDGIDDLVAAAVGDAGDRGAAFVYYGGATGFASTQYLPGPAGDYYFGYTLALADINGDGKSDLIAFTFLNGIAVYLAGSGSPALPSTPSFYITDSSAIYGLRQIGDLNGDGIQDLALIDSTVGMVYIIYGRSTLTGGNYSLFNADLIITGTRPTSGLGTSYGIAAVPDMDGDGKGELLLGAPGDRAAYLFLSTALAACGTTCTTTNATASFSVPTGSIQFAYAVAALDVNGDSFIDIAVSDPTTQEVYFWEATPSSHTYLPQYSWKVTGTGPAFGWNLTVADINLDTRPDLVVGANSSAPTSVGVLWSSNTGIAHEIGSFIAGGASFGESIVVSDFYGPQSPDIVIGEFINGNGLFSIFH